MRTKSALLFSFSLAFGALALLLLIIGSPAVPPARAAPLRALAFISDTFPLPNSHTAPLTSSVRAVYGQPVSATAVTSRTFAVHGMQSGLVTATHAVHGDTILVTPTRPLHQGELVYVIATSQTLSAPGPQQRGTQWQFNAGRVVSRCAGGFSRQAVPFPGVTGSNVAWGDYDDDGDLDVLLAGSNGSSPVTELWRNDGAGNFEQIPTALTDVTNGEVAWGDYDRDGDLDILLNGHDASGPVSGATTEVWRNDGGGNFSQLAISLTAASLGSVTWGDYDNDGDLDILITGDDSFGTITELWRNDGSDSFSLVPTSLTDVSNGNVVWGDYDGDGDLDVLLTGHESGVPVTELWRNDGGDVFTEITTATLTGVAQGSVAWGDYDNDGDLDLLLSGWTGSARVTELWRNDGGDVFTLLPTPLTGVAFSDATWGDYDNDGDLDVLLAGDISLSVVVTPVTELWRNNGGDLFSRLPISLTGVAHGSVTWGDYDGDSDLDILLAGSTGSGRVTELWRNDDCLIDLALTKTAAPDPATAGRSLVYTLTVANQGSELANGVTLSDALSPALAGLYQAVTPTQGNCVAPGSKTFTCTLGMLLPGQVVTIGAVAAIHPSAPGILTNTASVTATQDMTPTNNTVVLTTTVQAEADLRLVKTVSPSPVVPEGALLTYTLDVSNAGPSWVPGPITVTDLLPAGLTGVGASGDGWTCDVGQPAAGVVTCTREALALQAAAPIYITATAPLTPGVMTNTASVTSTIADPAPANNTDSVPVSVGDTPIAGLQAFNDGPTLVGDPTALWATVVTGTNVVYDWHLADGAATAAGATVTYTYPAPGLYTATVTATNSTSVLTATTTISITAPAEHAVYLPLIRN